MTWRRVLVAVGAAVCLVALLGVGSRLSQGVQDVLTQAQAERAWPAQRAELLAAVGAVRLPDEYRPVPCETEAPERCWQVAVMPADTLPDLEAALGDVADDPLSSSCAEELAVAGEPSGCASVAPLAGRTLALSVFRDVNPTPTSRDDLLLGTSTVWLSADLTPP